MGNLLLALALCVVALHELIIVAKNIKSNGLYL